MAILSNLEPKLVFSFFEKLCEVPHGSGNTRQISDLCAGFARELGLTCHQDRANNLIIWKDGSPGYENAAPVILQGHMDMVCAKEEGCGKDMRTEGLDLATDGQWVWARETSLGGDDCIAVAMILAILADDTLPHPPLEAVFTVDEEIGMGGAEALDCSGLKGRQLLNLDSEAEGVFTVSCAGGLRLDCRLPGEQLPLAGESGYALTISGLQGGHSGTDIQRGRASANCLMGRVLWSAGERIPNLRIAELRGGRFDNVICSRGEAKAAVPAGQEALFESVIRELDETLKQEYAGCDGGVTLTCKRTPLETAFSPEDTRRILRTLLILPQGVQAMSADFPGLVQTSLNLGVVKTVPEGIALTVSLRSSIASQKEFLSQQVQAVIESGGGTAVRQSAYPGWQYRRHSALRERLQETYRDLYGQDAAIDATHGGLECGLFMEKLPGLDAVSLGPELQHIHSVRERLNVDSAGRVYRLVCEFLRRSK